MTARCHTRAAEHRAAAWLLLDALGDEADDGTEEARLRHLAEQLAEVATMLDLGSDREPPEHLEAVGRHLRYRAIDLLEQIGARAEGRS